MKKKLEAELVSIAHRILKLKNKSELIHLHQETQNLYEKLSVLRFWEENFSDAKPTIGHVELEEKLETAFENREAISEVDNEEVDEIEDEISQSSQEENEVEETLDDVREPVAKQASTISEEIKPFSNEIVFDIAEPKSETPKLTFEDLLSDVHSDPIFERVAKSEEKEDARTKDEQAKQITDEPSNEIDEEQVDEATEEDNEIIEQEAIEEETAAEMEEPTEASTEIIQENPGSKNESAKKTITLGLNDRIAFEKHLFGGSAADLNRVISQLITYDTFEEAQDFIEEMVKPDYHNWEGKEEYDIRFMDIVEKKFK